MSIIIIFTTVIANLIWDIFAYINDIRKKNRSEKNMSVMTVTLDEFMNEHGDFVKQIVYKVDGDFNGNIEGKNITVILMGDGDINGNINAKNGEVFVNKGNINGSVKADKVLCPIPPTKYNLAKGVKSPTSQTKKELTCLDCIYCHLGFETMHCSVSNKVIRNLTPCIRFKGEIGI